LLIIELKITAKVIYYSKFDFYKVVRPVADCDYRIDNGVHVAQQLSPTITDLE